MTHTQTTHDRQRFARRPAILGVVTLLFVAGLVTPAGATERQVSQELSAENVEQIVLDGGNGSVHVKVGQDDVVRIQVDVRPEQWSDKQPWQGIKRWFLASRYDDADDLVQAIELDADRAGGKVRIGLDPSVRTRESRIREDWQITVPERLAVRLAMSDARVVVDGVAGGVDLSLGHGAVEIDVPGGDLDVDVTVGDVEVLTGSDSVGDLGLRSTVGKTRLWMNGLRVKYSDPPGPGSRVSLDGEGADSIEVRVEVGDADVRVNDR